MVISTNTVRPFIIWTLQRTGGTNLAQRLTERSGLPGTQHEPFNPGRIFGHITEQWIKDKDPEMLEQAVKAVCQRGVIIKHCVETVSWEVTEALARASAKAGYRHLFLYRKNAVDRLLSLHFAQKTGVWGPDLLNSGAREAAATSTPNAAESEPFAETVPVEKLVTHETSCVQLMTRAWQLSKSLGALPQAIAYEDIYRTFDPQQPAYLLLPLLQYLGLSENDAADRAWVSEVVGKGDQGTRNKYRDFPGVAELAKRIKAVVPFSPDGCVASIEAKIVAEQHPWIERCFIDVLPARVATGEAFDLGGVVVLSKEAPESLTLELEGSCGVVDIEWGMPSQRMAAECPQCKNSAKARFRSQRLYFHENEESLLLTLSGPNAERVVLAEVYRSVPPDNSRICIEPEGLYAVSSGA